MSLLGGRRALDYRDLPRRRRRGPFTRLGRLLGLAVLVYAALLAWTGRLVGRAEDAYRAGRLEEAHEILVRAARWRVRSGRVQDALGVVELSRGRLEEAGTHLALARGGFFHPAAFGEEDVLRSFLREGRYAPARAYASHRFEVGGNAVSAYYLAAAENGLNLLDEAETHLEVAAGERSLWEAVEAQRASLAAKRKRGRTEVLVDRTGAALAAVDLKSGHRGPVVSGLDWLLEGPGGPRLEPRDEVNRVQLTLHLEIQRAAEAALGSQRGALVVLDAKTGGLLAAASQPGHRGTSAGEPPIAFARKYEPGSITKMITLTAALRKGVDLEALFPMECPGWIVIDDIVFRDWREHARVESLDEAVAVSCNIAFGRIGTLVGRDALNAELRRFGFKPGPEPPASDFSFDMGALLPEDMTRPNYALARRSVGLDSLDITPVHAAMIASALNRGGLLSSPYMIQQKENILGEAYFTHPLAPEEPGALTPAQIGLIARTMVEAVGPSGTARRAAVEGLQAAIKTGTSGQNPPGHDALVIGYAPADDPIIAWGLVAEAAGKAELEGARITRAFLARVKPLLE